jgi:hypothetical protein
MTVGWALTLNYSSSTELHPPRYLHVGLLREIAYNQTWPLVSVST